MILGSSEFTKFLLKKLSSLWILTSVKITCLFFSALRFQTVRSSRCIHTKLRYFHWHSLEFKVWYTQTHTHIYYLFFPPSGQADYRRNVFDSSLRWNCGMLGHSTRVLWPLVALGTSWPCIWFRVDVFSRISCYFFVFIVYGCTGLYHNVSVCSVDVWIMRQVYRQICMCDIYYISSMYKHRHVYVWMYDFKKKVLLPTNFRSLFQVILKDI